jgi:hypothetical protein
VVPCVSLVDRDFFLCRSSTDVERECESLEELAKVVFDLDSVFFGSCGFAKIFATEDSMDDAELIVLRDVVEAVEAVLEDLAESEKIIGGFWNALDVKDIYGSVKSETFLGRICSSIFSMGGVGENPSRSLLELCMLLIYPS